MMAMIPGTSRSGATIVGALALGVSRSVAAEFTFFLAIPVMFGASALKLFKFGLAFTPMQVFLLLLGMIVSFAVSVIAIKFLMKYIKNHDFKAFGYYRIVLGIVVFFILRYPGFIQIRYVLLNRVQCVLLFTVIVNSKIFVFPKEIVHNYVLHFMKSML